MQTRSFVAPLALLALGGCSSLSTSKGPESDVPADGKLDSFREPTYMGQVPFGTFVRGNLTEGSRFHAFEFRLSDSAAVRISTAPVEVTPSDAIDTVVYLYAWNGQDWGSYVAKNDDDGDEPWSLVKKNLGEGRYRILVKGYDDGELGAYDLTVGCDGPGCVPADADDETPCALGTEFSNLRDDPAFEELAWIDLNVERASELADAEQAQILRGVQVAYEESKTLEEAFEAVDEGDVNLVRYRLRATGEEFTAVEYGAGENSYGAIFFGATTDLAAQIGDDWLTDCGLMKDGSRVDCDALDTYATDVCLPDDDAPVSWADCMADTSDYGYQTNRAASCCVEGEYLWCADLVGDRWVEAEKLPVPAPLAAVNGVRGILQLNTTNWDTLGDAQLRRVLALAHTLLGEECDAVPLGSAAEFHETSAAALVEHLRENTIDWEWAPTADEVEVLAAHFAGEGMASLRVSSGDLLGEACAGSGAGEFHLVYNGATARVLFMTLTEWSE